jgi:putative peptide zinc metalloprotease protein
MRSPLSLSPLLAVLVIVAALIGAPDTSRAQGSDGLTPVPAPPPAATPTLPPSDEDTMPDDEAADSVVVRREREDREEWQGGEHRPGDGGNNIVMVRNHSDGKMRVRGRIRLAELHGSRAEPINAAFAYASCTDCQTFAVALEIALIAPGASTIAPENHARAINYQCERCATVARALQYAFVVDDPSIVPDNVDRLMRDMEREIQSIGRERNITANEANARIDAVVAQFQDLAGGLQDQVEQTIAPTTPDAPAPAVPSVPAPSPSPVP